MNVSFDLNFWAFTIFLLNFTLAVGGIIAARHRATYEALDRNRNALQEHMDRNKENLQFDLTELRRVTADTEQRHSERIAVLEQFMRNAIDRRDLEGVHKRVDQVLEKLSEIGQSVSRLEGTVDARGRGG